MCPQLFIQFLGHMTCRHKKVHTPKPYKHEQSEVLQSLAGRISHSPYILTPVPTLYVYSSSKYDQKQFPTCAMIIEAILVYALRLNYAPSRMLLLQRHLCL